MMGKNENAIDDRLISEKAYQALRDAIIAGKLKPRERLTTSRLAETLGVSRTPVKIALDMLSLEGLVEVIPRSGAFVSDIFSDDLEEIYQMRSVLEGLAVRLAIDHIGEADLLKLEQIVNGYEAAIATNNRKLTVQLNAEFHLSVAYACKKRRLANEIKKLYDYCLRYRVLSLSEPAQIEKSYKGHHEILEAIKARDPDRAEQCVRLHLSKAPAFIYETLKDLEKENTLSGIKDFWNRD